MCWTRGCRAPTAPRRFAFASRKAEHARLARIEQRKAERVEHIVRGLDDVAARALLTFLKSPSDWDAYLLCSALGERLAAREAA